MKYCRTSLVFAAGWLFLQLAANATTTIATGNPYGTIAARNVFRLQPAPAREPENLSPAPVIILQGFTCRPSRKQALFKVGQTMFLLNEGDRQGGIEVLYVDEQTASVKFRNHGQVQVLYLGNPPRRRDLG